MSILQELKNRHFFKPKKNPLDFKITLAMCTNRGIDAQAVQRFIKAGNCTQPKISLQMKVDDSLIIRARSIIATAFLRSDSDVLIFVDDDIVYDPMDIIKLGLRVHDQGYDIIGGAYLTKTMKKPFFVFRELKKEPVKFVKKIQNPETEPYEVENISTGFMAISRKVVQEVSKSVPLCHENDPSIDSFYPMFNSFWEQQKDGGHIFKSEDWAFCTRARDAGFRVWIDTSIKLGHIGKHTYSWEDFVLAKMREDLGPVDSLIYNDFPSDVSDGGGEISAKEETQNG